MRKTIPLFPSTLMSRSTVLILALFWCFSAPFARAADDPAAADPVTASLARLAEITPENPGDFVFAVFGDNRSSTTVFERLLAGISDDPEILFAVSLGDIVGAGTPERFDFFFSQLKRCLTKPLFFTPGNHELMVGGPERYRTVVGPLYYSFVFRDAFFIIIDDARGGPIDPDQEREIKRCLEEADRYSETFVFMHQPIADPPDTDIRHSLPPATARQLLDLFRRHRITHLFCSHIHGFYQGTWEDIPYTISGGAGAPLIGKDPAHYFYHYLTVHVKDGTTTIEVVPVTIDNP